MKPGRFNTRRARTLLALGAASLLAAGWFAARYSWLPRGASTISLWHAADTFHQCSRLGPEPGDRFWIPTSAQIREIEAALPEMFAERKRLGLKMPEKSEADQPFRYHHQYIGFTQKGERLIYVNAYPFYDNGALNDHDFSLFEKPEHICDGGRFFWGIVYHPRLKTFDALEFNWGGRTETPEQGARP